MSAPEPILESDEESTGLPAFPTWRRVYAFVVAVFIGLVTLMVLLERAFS